MGPPKTRTSTETAMLKLLTFKCARAKKITIGECSYDCKACFDRINKSQSNILAKKQNVADSILQARAICIRRMKKHVKTGLGVSKHTYQQEITDEHELGGEIQGEGRRVIIIYTKEINTIEGT